VTIGSVTPFGRNQLRFDSTAGSNATDQFNAVRNVFAFRSQNGSPVLYITGPFTGQMSIDDSEFDGNCTTLDSNTNLYNIRIDDGGISSGVAPYSMNFRNTTSQCAWGTGSAAIYLGGTTAALFQGGHYEHDNGVIKEAIGSGGKGNWGVSVTDSYLATNTAINGGNGFWSSTDGNSTLNWCNNNMFGTPDAQFIGTLTNVNACPTTNFFSGGYEPGSISNFGAGYAEASLPTVPNGVIVYCNDCTIANPCASGGTGAFAKRLHAVWVCN
jgi:hypothetical protein